MPTIIDEQRIADLQLSIREGQARLADRKCKGRVSIQRAIRNAEIKIDYARKGLPRPRLETRDGLLLYPWENASEFES